MQITFSEISISTLLLQLQNVKNTWNKTATSTFKYQDICYTHPQRNETKVVHFNIFKLLSVLKDHED